MNERYSEEVKAILEAAQQQAQQGVFDCNFDGKGKGAESILVREELGYCAKGKMT